MARGSRSNIPPERSFFDRAKVLEEQRAALAADLKDVYAEAKDDGLDVKILRLAVKRARETEKQRRARLGSEQTAEELLVALGEFVHTPLGGAALAAVE